jgi:hypothetical protein
MRLFSDAALAGRLCYDLLAVRGICVSFRFFFAAPLLAACVAVTQEEGASRLGAPLSQAGAAPDPLQAAAADATLIAQRRDGAPWRAFLGADGSARRAGDGERGHWHVDEAGRLCTSFPDDRNCWWVERDGSSDPGFRGDRPGERARLARASPEL